MTKQDEQALALGKKMLKYRTRRNAKIQLTLLKAYEKGIIVTDEEIDKYLKEKK